MARDSNNKNKKSSNKKIDKLKKKITAILTTHIVVFTVQILIPIILIAAAVLTIFDWIREVIDADNTAQRITEVLEVQDISELVEITGNDEDGYNWTFVSDIDDKLDTLIEDLEDNPDVVTIDDKEMLKTMIKAELITQYPDLGGQTFDSEDGEDDEADNNFQGAIHLRRVMPDRDIGDMENVSTDATVQNYNYVTADSEGLGTKEDIPSDIREQMEGVSMNGISGTSYDDLSYLTIPYYNFDGEVKRGHLIVNKLLADEVLLIFQELYNIQYPIENMDIIDEYADRMADAEIDENDESIEYGVKLDRTSMYFNNTSSFNDRNTSDGTASNHAKGCAIDVNPKINPFVSGDYHSPSNAELYADRSMEGWNETEKEAVINQDSEIYEIFTRYGWSWGGDWEGDKDYQHFEKTDLTEITFISNNGNEEVTQNGNSSGSSSSSQFLVQIDNPDTSYTGQPWTVDNRDLLERLVFGEYGTDYTGAVLVAQTIRDNMRTENTHDVAYIIEEYGYSGSTANAPNQTAKDAVAYVFDQGNSGVQHKLMCFYQSATTQSSWHEAQNFVVQNGTVRFFDYGEPLSNTGTTTEQQTYTIVVDAGHGDPSQSGGYGELATNQQELDEGKAWYTSGTSGTTPSGETWTEWETVQRVVDYVIEMMQDYPNIQVIQTGKNQPNCKRIELAKEAGADAYIGVHLNGGGGNGTLTMIREGQGENETYRFADILLNTVSESLGLEKQNVLADDEHTRTGLQTYDQCGIPAVYIEGGFMDSATDMQVLGAANDEGLRKYAQGIVNGILQYCDTASNSGTSGGNTSSNGNVQANAGIRSRIFDLRYVSQEKFSEDLENGNEEVLEEFTMNDSGNIVVATWSYNSDNGGVSFSEKTFQVAETYTQQYTMPMEYLIAYYIDTGNKDFVYDLANLAMDSEFVLAIQDNVTITQTDTENFERVVTTITNRDDSGNEETSTTDTTNQTGSSSNIIESVSTSIELTYGDAWFVKFYKDINYSSDDLSSAVIDGEVDEDNNRVDAVVEINGTANISSTFNREETGPRRTSEVTRYRTIRRAVYTIVETTTNQNRYQYNTGEVHVIGDESGFIDICRGNEEFKGALKPEWLFTLLERQEDTVNMVDLTKYLLYRATGQNTSFGVDEFNYSEYAPEDFNQMSSSSGSGLSLTTTMFSRDVFLQAMQAYYDKTGNQAFHDNFLVNAEVLYDTAVANNVNPELVVITAKCEGNFRQAGGSYNYWGISVPNGASSGRSFSSFAEGVERYAYIINGCMPGGYNESKIMERYEQRKDTGCDPNGYGLPGTMGGMQSVYSWLGKHGEAYSGSGAGGYYYMDPAVAGVTKIYATHEEFVQKCLNGGPEHASGTDCTPYEQGQYTAWQVEKKLEVWEDIFGDYGTLSSSGGGTIVQNAIEVHRYVRENGYHYAQAGISVPNENGSTIDCSSFVTWVLVNAGVEGFTPGMGQWSSGTFRANPYGWEVISPENVQPGDILAYVGHVEIYAGTSGGRMLVYNCGSNASINASGTDNLEEASGSGRSLNSALILRVPGT